MKILILIMVIVALYMHQSDYYQPKI